MRRRGWDGGMSGIKREKGKEEKGRIDAGEEEQGVRKIVCFCLHEVSPQ